MRKAHLIFAILFIILFSPFVKAEEADRDAPVPAGKASIEIMVMGERISLEAKNAEIGEVIDRLSTETGVDIYLGEDISGLVNLQIGGNLEGILRRLLKNRALIYEKLADGKRFRVLRASGYKSSPESPGPIEKGGQKRTAQGEKEKLSSGLKSKHNNTGFIPDELLIRYAYDTDMEALEALHREMGSTVISRITKFRLLRVRLKEREVEEAPFSVI